MCPGGMVSVVGVTEIVKSPAPSVAVLLVARVPPLVELTLPVVLLLVPEVVGVTFTLTAHELLAEIVPPLRLIEVLPAVAVNVPPHVLVAFGVAATCRPPGKVSVTATPLKAVPVFGLVMVKVRVEVPPTATLVGEKPLLMLGGATTVRPADAVLPVPPLLEVTLPLVLVYDPATVPVTVTLNWHWLLVLMPAPDNAIPVGEVVVSVPPQTVAELFATVKPVGSVSVNPTPVSATGFAAGLVMVNVRDVVPFRATVEEPNAFAIEGGPSTASVAVLLVAPAPVSVELTAPVVLDLVPAVVPVTFTVMEHEPPDASVPPVKLMVLEPAVYDGVPLQVLLAPFGVDTTKPAGRLSVKVTPVRPKLELGLVIVSVRLVNPLSGIVAAPNALLMVGGVATLRLALAVLPVPPLVELTLPVVLFLVPEVVAVTFTTTVQLLLTAMLPPVSEMLPLPATAVGVPPQLLVKPLGVATTSPAGNVSVNPTPASATVLAAGLVMVNVNAETPFTAIDEGLNALAIEGGATTVRETVLLALPVPASLVLIGPVGLGKDPAVELGTFTEIAHG